MATVKLSDAPGCIGSPIIRAEDHPICRNCLFTNICGKLATRNKARLEADLGISELSKDTGKKLVKGAEKLTIRQLEDPNNIDKQPLTTAGKRMQGLLLTNLSGPEQLHDALKQSDRQQAEHDLQFVKPVWAAKIMLLMWDNDGEITKKDMREYMTHDVGLTQMVVNVHASTFINAMTNLDLIKQDKTKLRIIT